jgi:hypothetical protein
MATKSKATELTTIVRAGVKPDRAADNLTISHQLVGGLTSWHKKKVVRVSAPMVRGAHARTVRIHEMLRTSRCIVFTGRIACRSARTAIV